MREIIFRGKTFAGSWVYGHYQSINIPERVYHSISNREVIPETVGQFTGILDKKGNRIFEGDVLSIEGITHTYYVVFEKGCFCTYHINLKDAMGNDLKWGLVSRYEEIRFKPEIIGNIHDPT